MINERKGLLAALVFGLIAGFWGGVRLASRPSIERQASVIHTEDNKKVETVEVVRIVREPSGRVEVVREIKKTAQESSQAIVKEEKESISSTVPKMNRLEVGLDLRGDLQHIGASRRILSGLWLGVGFQVPQRAALLTIAAEF